MGSEKRVIETPQAVMARGRDVADRMWSAARSENVGWGVNYAHALDDILDDVVRRGPLGEVREFAAMAREVLRTMRLTCPVMAAVGAVIKHGLVEDAPSVCRALGDLRGIVAKPPMKVVTPRQAAQWPSAADRAAR